MSDSKWSVGPSQQFPHHVYVMVYHQTLSLEETRALITALEAALKQAAAPPPGGDP